MNKQIGLYLHVPFCLSKCRYCDFYSLPSYSDGQLESYVEAAKNQILVFGKELADGYTVDTVYVGGGTPTVLGKRWLPELLSTLGEAFPLESGAEFTVEANPATVNPELLSAMLQCGVNRLSFGVQSADKRELESLGRIHSFEDFVDSFYMARNCGFANISADLMLAIPYQTKESCLSSLAKITDLAIEHVSLYGLRIEEGTPFFTMREKLPLPSEDEEREMYLASLAFLSEKGYHQYEISNFAKDGYESRHNLRYWDCRPYLGIGPGAHSYYEGCRFSVPGNLIRYIKESDTPLSKLAENGEKLSDRDCLEEQVFLGLRKNEGIAQDVLSHFTERESAEKRLRLFRDKGLIGWENGRIFLTGEGMLVSNSILSDLLLYL